MWKNIQVLKADTLVVDSVNEGLELILRAGAEYPFGDLAFGVVLLDLVGHHVAGHFHSRGGCRIFSGLLLLSG